MEKRQNDIFMSMLANPQASFNNIVTVGLTAENTSLQDKDVYLNNRFVQEQFKTHDDKFDRAAFDKAYDIAKLYYNNLADADFEKAMEDQMVYHRDNIDNIEKERSNAPLFQEIKISNPYEQNFSTSRLGRVDEPTQSEDELAQKNKVLANPTTAGADLKNAVWEDSPNDSFFGHFFDTLVMAQYDEDGEHVDPISGEIVKHYKGQLKTDNDGSFYYEKLDGRDVYGRRVLNKMNVLTTDGSALNKYDFFDSDDLQQKGVGASILKNAALVGSMFIPYVGPWIAGLSVATQIAGMGATFGKMLVGSDSPVLSSIEGWAKSMNRQTAKTQYAQEHTWCWENFIDLIGDVAGQLKEQRFIFERIPAIVTGVDLSSEAKYIKKLKDWKKQYKNQADETFRTLSKNGLHESKLASTRAALRGNAAVAAQAKMDSFIKGYNNLGKVLSMGYMTGITTADTYGEAKQAGASDLDATLITLGYSAAEFALLNSDIGKWILPELRADRYKNKAIMEALTRHNDETKSLYEQFGASLGNMPKEGKKAYVKKLFNIGKNIARGEYSTGVKSLRATLAAGVAEGTEEVSEEILADFSKGCYNVVNWLRGDDTRMNSFGFDGTTGDWNGTDILDRYGMSLIGGAVGGSLTNAFTSYRQFKNLGNMTSQQAVQQLVYMGRNGQLKQFERELDRSIVADKNKSATDFIMEGDQLVFAPGTKENNQDLYAKKAIKETLRMIDHVLKAEGANLSDESFLNKQTLSDLRFNALHNSAMAGIYLNEFNTLSSNLVKMQAQLSSLKQSAVDTNQDETVTDKEKRSTPVSETNQKLIDELENKIQDTRAKLTDLVNGKYSYEFISDALFEMTTDLSKDLVPASFPLYAENETGRKYEELTENEKAVLYKKYEVWKTGDGRDRIRDMASIFRNVLQQAGTTIREQADHLKESPAGIDFLERIVQTLYTGINTTDENVWLSEAQERQTSAIVPVMQTLLHQFGSDQDIEEVEQLQNRMKAIDKTKRGGAGMYSILGNKLYKKYYDLLLNNVSDYLQPIIQRGFANTETKEQLGRVLDHLGQVAMVNYTTLEGSDTATDAELNVALNRILNIQRSKEEIAKLDQTPFEKNLNEFSISIGKNPVNIGQLLVQLNRTLDNVSGNITQFNMDSSLYGDLVNAINTIEMYKAALKAMRTDNADLGNYFGYTATLNEINKKMGLGHPELVEIQGELADRMLADLQVNLNKLYFIKKLYQLNQGQKLSKQDRVGVTKDILIYNRIRNIVNVPDDDPLKQWDGFLELQNTVNSMEKHEAYSQGTNRVVDDADKVTFEKEKIALEDAIYDFFQKNKDKLNDATKLQEFVNPKRFQLYTTVTKLLNEDLTDIDDNSMLWWIASRVAVKSSDFYTQYKEILDPAAEHPLAPVATQEMSAYLAYSSIVNGNILTQFYNAARQSLVNDWKSRSQEERKKLLKLMKKSEGLSDQNLDDFAINFLPVPRYANTVLIEGIAGSGKTTAVLSQVVAMLKRTSPDLLKKVAVIHGATLEGAEEIKKNTGLSDAVTYDKRTFMKLTSPEWKEYGKNPETKKRDIPVSDFKITGDGELRSALKTGNLSDFPQLVIIDEISKFSSYDMDLIDQMAQQTGATVVVLGDFDQIGETGRHPVKINGTTYDWTVSLEKSNFINSLKLGVAMRTDNLLKTKNQQTLQAFMQEMPNHPIEFDYYSDDTGLYGDLVLSYTDSDQSIDKNILIPELKKQLDSIIATLKPGEKIGYIYSDASSPIYKLLHSAEYEQFIDDKQGDSALGQEGRYYITEVSPDRGILDTSNPLLQIEAILGYLKKIYTGITRSQQGSILIVPENIGPKFNSVKKLEKVSDKTNPQIIAQYTKRRKKILEEAVQNGNKITYTPRKSYVQSSQNKQSVSNKGGLNSGVVAQPPKAPKAKPAPIVVSPTGTPSIPSHNYNTIPLSSCPENIREELLDLQEKAIQYPHTDDNFDTDDSKTDLKYGQVICIGDPSNGEFGVIFGVRAHANGEHEYFVKDVINGNRVISSDSVSALVSTQINQNVVLSHEAIKNSVGSIADVASIIVNIDGHDTVLPLCQIPFINAQGESGVSNIVTLGLSNGRRYDMVVVDLNGAYLPYYWNGAEWTPFFGIKGDTLNTSESMSGLFLDISSSLGQQLGTSGIYDPMGTVFNRVSEKELPQVDLINRDFDPAEENDPDYADKLKNNIMETMDRISSAIEQLVPEQVVPPIEKTGYENQPVTGMEVVNEEEYKDKLDTENDEEDVPEPVVEEATNSLQMLLHSHNTFELGVFEDEETGMPVQNGGEQWGRKRIDSVNGLMKIDTMLGRPVRTVREYETIIARLRDLMFNVKDKSELNENIRQILGLQEINVIFALRNNPYMGERMRSEGKEFVEDTPSIFSKGISERTQFNGSSDEHSSEWHNRAIVAVITTGNKAALELPLLALSSPFTLLHKYGLGERLESLRYSGMSMHDISIKLGNDLKTTHPELSNLFRLFDMTDRNISFIRDENWTIANGFETLGPQFFKERGKLQSRPGYEYDLNSDPAKEWDTVDEFIKNPQVHVTPVLGVRQDVLANNGSTVLKTGHSFVLISYDLTLNRTNDIIDYYMEQIQDPTKPKKVQRIYVLPPKASVSEYVDNLNKIFGNQSGVKPIGYLQTSYKVVKVLAQNNEFRTRIESRYPGIMSRIDQELARLDVMDSSERSQALFEEQDWSNTSMTHKRLALSKLFDNVIMSFVYSRNNLNSLVGLNNTFVLDKDNLLLLQDIVDKAGLSIFYNVRYDDKWTAYNGVIINPSNKYDIDGKPFMMPQKVDSPMFRGDVGWLVQQFLDELIPVKNTRHLTSYDALNYMNGRELVSRRRNVPENSAVEYIRQKLKTDLSDYYKGKSVEEGNKAVINYINSTVQGRVAFAVNGKLQISNMDVSLGTNTNIYDGQMRPIHDLSGLADNNGVYSFRLVSDGESYNAEYKEGQLTLTSEVRQEPTVKMAVTDTNFEEFMKGAQQLLLTDLKLSPFYKGLHKLMKSETYEDFLENLKELNKGEFNNFRKKLSLEQGDNPLIEQLAQSKRAMDETEQSVQCPLNIYIKV